MSQHTDPLSDLFTRLRNGARARLDHVHAPFSKVKGDIARLLKEEGYIKDYFVDTKGSTPRLHIINKYFGQTPAITGLKRVSKPGLRRYVSATAIPRVLGGMGVAMLSTSSGIMSGQQAKRINVGGELLGIIW